MQAKHWNVALAAIVAATAALAATAQERFPSRAVDVVVPWGAGGGADILGRIVGKWIETDLKVPAPVINMPGASGMIGLGKLVGGNADGYSIAILTGDSLMAAAAGSSAFNMKDTVALGVMVRQPSGIFAPTNGRFRTWQDVVAAVKAKPGSVSIAITGPNTADDLTIRYLQDKQGLALTGVPYTRPGERYAAVLGGHVDLLYEQAGDVRSYLDGNQMRPLVFFAPRRLAAPFADVPVSADLGYEILLPQVRAVLAKAGTDPARLQALGASLERFAASPDYGKFIEAQIAQPDSFLAARPAQAFLDGELEASRKLLSTYSAK